MSFRLSSVGVFLLALALGACASAGSGGNDGGIQGITEEFDEEDLPEWVEALPEGEPPRDNEHTDQAFFFLAQGMGSEGEQADEYFRRALEEAQAGIEADPGNPQSYFQAGEAHVRLGNYEEASEMFDRAEEIYPRYVLEIEGLREEAWIEIFNEGVEFYAEGDVDAAIPYFERANSIYRGRPEAMLNLAEIYTERERLSEAAELYEGAMEAIETTRERSDDLDEELDAQWDEFMEISRFNLAQIYFQEERYAEAAEVYETLLENHPDDLAVLSNLAVALVASGREDEARALYDELLSRPDLDAQDYYIIGVGLYQAEEYEEAARAFRQSWELVPENRDALFNYTQSLYLSDQYEELGEVGDELEAADPYNENGYRIRAYALSAQERQDDALVLLEAAEALPFFTQGMQLTPFEGGVAVVGQIINQNESPGTPVDMRFTFYDLDGNPVGSTETTVQLGEQEEPVQFQAEIETQEPVFAYSYEVL